MLQEIQTQEITLTPGAASAINEIMKQRNLDGYALRVFVSGGGCCGAQFGMALDNNVHSNDKTLELEGVKVVVDDNSIEYLRGARIDYILDAQNGPGFMVDSPSARKEGGSCSCGQGQHSHEASSEEGSSCGCGGSCSCNN
jgi:iron-sulfur cluster assembly accessory protein